MISDLFNYHTLKVSFFKDTKSVQIDLNQTKNQNAINAELLFELETLFNWLSNHLEIQTLFLTSNHAIFGSGFDHHELSSCSKLRIEKLIKQHQRLIFALFHLPQTLVVDFRQQVAGPSFEFALAADFSIMEKNGTFDCDYLKRGLLPSTGGMGFYERLFGHSVVKKWMMTSEKVSAQDLKNLGVLSDLYQEDERLNLYAEINQRVSLQSQVQRVQAKKMFLNLILADLQKYLDSEISVLSAGLQSMDYQEAAKGLLEERDPHFKNILTFSKEVKFRQKFQETKQDDPEKNI
jgi:enoyl-CoA hydratase/carnithine racemase